MGADWHKLPLPCASCGTKDERAYTIIRDSDGTNKCLHNDCQSHLWQHRMTCSEFAESWGGRQSNIVHATCAHATMSPGVISRQHILPVQKRTFKSHQGSTSWWH